MENVVLEMVEYRPEHQPWFEKFNRQWIEEYFWMEPIDFEVLQHPDEYIISKGGKILVALYNKEIAGTVALKYVDPTTFEFTKMQRGVMIEQETTRYLFFISESAILNPRLHFEVVGDE